MDEQGLPWWFWVGLVVVGACVIAQIVYPNEPILAIMAVIIGLIAAIFLFKALGWFAVIIAGVVIVVVFGIFGCNVITTWGTNFGNTIPTPKPPTPTQVWAYQEIGWPAMFYLFFIAVGYVTTWMTGAKGPWAAIITIALSYLGALLLGQADPWISAAVIGFIGAILSLLLKFFSKPAGGAAPLAMAIGGLLFGAIYIFVTPLQSWVVLSFGLMDPTAGVTAILGYSAGSFAFSTLLDSLLGG